jgi:hypothetical protein
MLPSAKATFLAASLFSFTAFSFAKFCQCKRSSSINTRLTTSFTLGDVTECKSNIPCCITILFHSFLFCQIPSMQEVLQHQYKIDDQIHSWQCYQVPSNILAAYYSLSQPSLLQVLSMQEELQHQYKIDDQFHSCNVTECKATFLLHYHSLSQLSLLQVLSMQEVLQHQYKIDDQFHSWQCYRVQKQHSLLHTILFHSLLFCQIRQCKRSSSINTRLTTRFTLEQCYRVH